MTYNRKLIEVALPLDAINTASAREKSTRRGHGPPSTLHLWWARRPLAAARCRWRRSGWGWKRTPAT
jgi:putative DNA methylase